MASYTVHVLAKPLTLTPYVKPGHHAQPNKVLVAIQLLSTVDLSCFPLNHHLLSWKRWSDVGLNATEVVPFPCGKKNDLK